MTTKELFEDELNRELTRANREFVDADNPTREFKFRLLADECVTPRTLSYLDKADFNITRSPKSLTDPKVFDLASRSGCILVTYDRDFLNHDKFDPLLIRGLLILPSLKVSANGCSPSSVAHDAALNYFVNNLPRSPCWWFYKKVAFRYCGEFDVQTLAPKLDKNSPYRAYSRSTYRFMPLKP